MLTPENRDSLTVHAEHALTLGHGLIHLSENNLLNQESRNIVMTHARHANTVARAFVYLSKNNLLNTEIHHTVMTHPGQADDVAVILSYLLANNLLSPVNQDLVVANTEHVGYVAVAVKYLSHHYLLNQKNFSGVTACARYADRVTGALQYLSEHSRLDTANCDAVMACPKQAESVAIALVHLATNTLLNQKNRNAIIANAEQAPAIAGALSFLPTSLLNQENFDAIISHADQAQSVSGAFLILSGRNLLDHRSFNMIMALAMHAGSDTDFWYYFGQLEITRKLTPQTFRELSLHALMLCVLYPLLQQEGVNPHCCRLIFIALTESILGRELEGAEPDYVASFQQKLADSISKIRKKKSVCTVGFFCEEQHASLFANIINTRIVATDSLTLADVQEACRAYIATQERYATYVGAAVECFEQLDNSELSSRAAIMRLLLIIEGRLHCHVAQLSASAGLRQLVKAILERFTKDSLSGDMLSFLCTVDRESVQAACCVEALKDKPRAQLAKHIGDAALTQLATHSYASSMIDFRHTKLTRTEIEYLKPLLILNPDVIPEFHPEQPDVSLIPLKQLYMGAVESATPSARELLYSL